MIYSEINHPNQQKRGSIEVICGSMWKDRGVDQKVETCKICKAGG